MVSKRSYLKGEGGHEFRSSRVGRTQGSHNKDGSNPLLKGRLKSKLHQKHFFSPSLSYLSIMFMLNTVFWVVNVWMLD